MQSIEQVPDFSEASINEESLSEIIGEDGELVLLHEPRTISTKDRTIDDARFVSCYTVIDAPPDEVRDFAADFENYKNLLDFIRTSTIVDNNGPSVEFSVSMRTPVVEPQFNYVVNYNMNERDITFRSVRGDFDLILGRWEFISLKNNKTLLVYSSWFEFGSLSWTLRTIFWAQPDLKLTIPITQASVLIHSMKNELDNRSSNSTSSNPESLPTEPDIPFFTENSSSLEDIAPLCRKGILMKVHPEQWIQDENNALNIRFVTGIGLMNVGAEKAKEYTTDFESYTDYISQVSEVEMHTDEDGNRIGKWKLDLGVNILSIGLNYTIKYIEITENILSFRRVAGDIQYVYGGLEWEAIDEDNTLFFYTTATQIGSGDSFIVKMANILPHKQIIMGIAAGAMAVDKLVESINSNK